MNLADLQLIVRMNHDVELANMPGSRLKKGQTYRATFATNQPHWVEEQKVFVFSSVGLEILLAVTDGTFVIIGFAVDR